MKRIKRIIIILLCSVCLSLCVPVVTVQANGIANIEAFNKLKGDAKYLGEAYRDNYYLDIEDSGLFDSNGWSIINGIANVIFGIIKQLAYLVCSIFYYAISFDMTSLFSPYIAAMQEALKKSIFEPLFMLACVGTGCLMIKKLLRGYTIGVFTEVLKIILVVVLSIALVKHSSSVLTMATSLAKEVSLQSLLSLNGSMGSASGQKDFAEQAAGVLWVNLVHEPWKTFEFGNDLANVHESSIERLLSNAYSIHENKTNRQVLIEQLYLGCFKNDVAISRAGGLIVYLIPFFLKCIVFLVVALLQLFFQLQAVFLFILAPIVLLLALVPGYEMTMITRWMRKVLESQISILIVTLIMGLLIRVDSLLYGLSGKYGWFVMLFFQTALGIGLILSKNQIFHLVSSTVPDGGNMTRSMRLIPMRMGRGRGRRRYPKSSDVVSEKQNDRSDRISKAVSRDKMQTQPSNDQRASTYNTSTQTQDSTRVYSGARNNAIPEGRIDTVEQGTGRTQTAMYESGAADVSSTAKRPRMDSVIENESISPTEERPITYLGSGYDSSREILKKRGLWTDDIEMPKYESSYGTTHVANSRGSGTVYESGYGTNNRKKIKTQIEHRDSDISRALQRSRRDAFINSTDRETIAERPVTNWKNDTINRPYSVNTDSKPATHAPYGFNNDNTYAGSANKYEGAVSEFNGESQYTKESYKSNMEKAPKSKRNKRNQETVYDRKTVTRSVRRDSQDFSRRKVSVTDSASQSYERANLHMNRNKRPVIRTDTPKKIKHDK